MGFFVVEVFFESVESLFGNFKFIDFSEALEDDTESDDEELAGFLTSTKLYIVIACIAALVLVAIVQASCTIYKMATKPSNVTTTKVCN